MSRSFAILIFCFVLRKLPLDKYLDAYLSFDTDLILFFVALK